MESKIVSLPELHDDTYDIVLLKWAKGIGEKVRYGEVLATIETGKTLLDIESSAEGYLSGPLVKEGSKLNKCAELGYVVDVLEHVVARK